MCRWWRWVRARRIRAGGFFTSWARTAPSVGRLLVSELYADDGCWSGYPPHKHDTEHPPEETDFEEIYHYRFRPETGFGAQFCYDGNGGEPVVAMTRHGDTFLVDRGYHPSVTSPAMKRISSRCSSPRQAIAEAELRGATGT